MLFGGAIGNDQTICGMGSEAMVPMPVGQDRNRWQGKMFFFQGSVEFLNMIRRMAGIDCNAESIALDIAKSRSVPVLLMGIGPDAFTDALQFHMLFSLM